MKGFCCVSYAIFLLKECFRSVLRYTLLYRYICVFRHIAPRNCRHFDMNQHRMREAAENEDK